MGGIRRSVARRSGRGIAKTGDLPAASMARTSGLAPRQAMRERSGAPYATRAAEPRTQHSTAALSLEATELLYIKSTSKEQTLILTRVVKGKSTNS